MVWKATELREDWEQVKLRDFPSRLVPQGGFAAKKVETFRFEDENHYEYEIGFKVFSRIVKKNTSEFFIVLFFT